MKQPFLRAVLSLTFAAAIFAGCSSSQVGEKAASAKTTFAASIPDRPEKISYPPFEFHPPKVAPYRVPLQSGPVAYVVPDHELPLVNIAIYIRTGDWVEPDGKEGLTDICGGLLTHAGTATRTAQELEERLAFLAAQLSSSIRGAEGTVQLNLLSKDLDEGLTILREVLTTPRFQQDRIDLQKQQMLQGMQQRNDSSASIEGIESGYLAYGEKFWDNRHQTKASVESITRDDLIAFQKKWFFPSNFIVAVSGDFDRGTMLKKLEKLFGDWPWTGTPPPPIPQNISLSPSGVYVVNKDVNQGRVSMMLPGIMRSNPDYYPLIMMNDILGGGGFTSRIVNRVRSDEGLAYSAGSSFPGGIYFPYVFTANFQSKSRTVSYAASIVVEEMKRIIAEPVKQEELENAKRGFIERLPRAFGSKAQIANMLANEEFTGRYATNPDFWQTVVPRMNAVTIGDVQRVAKKYLTLDKLVILVVGQKDEILKGHPNHTANLAGLAGGKLTELPLRGSADAPANDWTGREVTGPAAAGVRLKLEHHDLNCAVAHPPKVSAKFMLTYLWIAIGGALGSVGRYWLNGVVSARFGETFPMGTLAVNVSGSFVIGVLGALTIPEGRMGTEARGFATQFLMIGVCGGFTTFSSFSLQTLNLVREREWLYAGGNVMASVTLCLVATWLGYLLGSAFNSMKGH